MLKRLAYIGIALAALAGALVAVYATYMLNLPPEPLETSASPSTSPKYYEVEIATTKQSARPAKFESPCGPAFVRSGAKKIVTGSHAAPFAGTLTIYARTGPNAKVCAVTSARRDGSNVTVSLIPLRGTARHGYVKATRHGDGRAYVTLPLDSATRWVAKGTISNAGGTSTESIRVTAPQQ